MIRIAMLAIGGVLMALQLKSLKQEYSVCLCIGISLLIFWQATEQLQVILNGMKAVENCLPVHVGYLRTLMKIVGITYISELASDLCRDAGYQGIAGQVQMFGKLSVLAVSIPILTALLNTIQSFLGG